MAKDPGFIFYPGDYLRDTQCLSERVQVAYDRIMCEHMRNICISQAQLDFFTKRLNEDEKSELLMVLMKVDCGYTIEWVHESICKRRAYSESRRKNRTTKDKNISSTYVKHMEIENEIENEDIIEVKKGFIRGFQKPTIQEVEVYFYEKFTEGQDTASHFYDHYESNGWKVGKNPMKDWKGAVRNWMRNKSNFNKNGTDKDKPAFGRLSKATIDRFIPPGTTNPIVEKYLKGDV